MQPVILAAGEGSRLNPHTEDIPKLFVEVGGQTILDWQIAALEPLAEEGLVDDVITLVLGHGFEDVDPENPTASPKLDSYLPSDSPFDFRVATLSDWDEVENATSARRGIEGLDDDALLLCGDVILAEEVLRRIVETFEDEHSEEGLNTVSAIEGIQNEMTAVTWDDEERITDYGAIEGHQEAGVFVLNSSHFETARRLWDENGTDWFPIVFSETPSKAVTIEDASHHEINTEHHLREAEANLPFESQ